MGFENQGEGEKITLVATEIPEGMIVHTELGVSSKVAWDQVLMNIKKRYEGGVEKLRAVRASKVGLEWRGPDGQKLKNSDKWAKESYVWVSYKE